MDKMTERLYDLAYRFKETKLWEQLGDDQLFGVKHADGMVSYCSVLGQLGQEYALNIYTGPEGFASYLRLIDLANISPEPVGDPFLEGEMRHAQKCLSCSFENRDFMSDEEAKEVRSYTKTHGISLRGKNMYAVFLEYKPGYHPWKIESDTEKEHLCDALEAAVCLAELLKKEILHSFMIRPYWSSLEILLFSRKGANWSIADASLPKTKFAYPAPQLTDELRLQKIRKMKKEEVWQCAAFFSPAGVGDRAAGERPYYPLILLGVTEEPAYVRPIHMGKLEEPEAFLTVLADHITEGHHCPRIIRCADERCTSLLKDFCRKTGIRLETAGDLEAITEAEYDLYAHMADPEDGMPNSEEDAEEMMKLMLEDLSRMSDAELRQMPEGLVRAVLGLPGFEKNMPELFARMKKLFGNR